MSLCHWNFGRSTYPVKKNVKHKRYARWITTNTYHSFTLMVQQKGHIEPSGDALSKNKKFPPELPTYVRRIP